MADWAGFSDQELMRMQQRASANPVVPGVSGRGRRPAPTNRSRQQLQMERALKTAARKQASDSFPLEQCLTKPHAQASIEVPATPLLPKESAQPSTQDGRTTSVPQTEPDTETAPVAKELDKEEMELREKTPLELIQREQRMMEDKNKRKKALLSKMLAEKSRRTQAEAVKLNRIQRELQALDYIVSNDIGILRGRIEEASWDYSTARKRYDRAEVEFVAAKLDLLRKAEMKERLTEHLCAIIQQNELRKALKLQELMEQLELQPGEESLDLENLAPEGGKGVGHQAPEGGKGVEHQASEGGNGAGDQASEGGKGAGPDVSEGGRCGAKGKLKGSLPPGSEPKKSGLHSEA